MYVLKYLRQLPVTLCYPKREGFEKSNFKKIIFSSLLRVLSREEILTQIIFVSFISSIIGRGKG